MAQCLQCRDTLPEGVRFCAKCGCHNYDADAAVGNVLLQEFEAEQRREELRRRLHLLPEKKQWP